MESASAFPFRKLVSNIYLTVDVMINIEHYDAYQFMFNLNKDAREFIKNNFIAVRNGFINEGLNECVGFSSYSIQLENY